MNVFLQYGYGMMSLSKILCQEWGGGTVILSPRDMNEKQMLALSQFLSHINATTLIDPQFYNPRANHHGLTKFNFWPNDYDTSLFWGTDQFENKLELLFELNQAVGTTHLILPGLHASRADEDFFSIHDSIIESASHFLAQEKRIATICVSDTMLHDEDQLERIINAAQQWSVGGYYIVPEYKTEDYLKEDPVWLVNLINLCWGLKLHKRKVFVGYANHQLLCLALAKVDAIASGNWKNVRSFYSSKFDEPEEGSITRRVKWYYCAKALSEFKIPFLDQAQRNGVLDTMRPELEMNSYDADVLFSGAAPSDTDYAEQQSFKHYLTALRYQALKCSSFQTFDETVQYQYQLLNEAKKMLTFLHHNGVRGQDRDFYDFVDVNLSAIDSIIKSRGLAMRMQWNNY